MKLNLIIVVLVTTVFAIALAKSHHKPKDKKVDPAAVVPGAGALPVAGAASALPVAGALAGGGAGGLPGSGGAGGLPGLGAGGGSGLPSPNCVADIVCPGGKPTHGRPNLAEVDLPGTDTSVVEVLSPHPNPFKNPFEGAKFPKNPFDG